ncbi:MAG: putative rRNA maturation factor [Clostridia bacterium]|nr:putative rRNA maturation factor [Clostridia bacterium]
MECSINNQQDDFSVGDDLIAVLEEVLRIAGNYENVEERTEVSLTLVDDNFIRELNRVYRNIDKPTDVLSFALEETGPEEIIIQEDIGERLLGDIFISVPTAINQAKEYGHSPKRELAFLAVHGFLHLLGYDHETEAEAREMETIQEKVLSEVGLKR